jgi:ABC-type transporter Mla maintaining outer membrane lipid asymmetry ATPase subunit MlaF
MDPASDMAVPLLCRDLLFSDNCAPLTLSLKTGRRCVVQLCDEESADLLLQTLIGLRRPAGGQRLLFGTAPESLPEARRHILRRRIGVVADYCGLISNLTVLENLLLPSEYTGNHDRARLETSARQMLEKVGYQGEEVCLPGHLKLLQKRQVLLARALLTDPELMLFGTFLSGLSVKERALLLDVALAFQPGESHAATLFLSSDASFTTRLTDTDVCNLIKGENHDR